MMKVFAPLIFVFAFFIPKNTLAQQQFSGWLASFNTWKINNSFSIHDDIQLRSGDRLEKVQTILMRVGLNYHFKSNQTLTVGGAYIPNRATAENHSSLLAEHRFWQQYNLNQNLPIGILSHRFRLEERWVPRAILSGTGVETADRLYSTRLRYFARAVIPVKKQKPFVKGVFVALQNEAFGALSHKQNVNGRFFDQNRAYLALGYRLSAPIDLEIGYMNQWIQRKKGQQNISNHLVQVAVYTRL